MFFLNDVAVNWMGILLAALAYFILGIIWYAPALFGHRWFKHEWNVTTEPRAISCMMCYVGEVIIGLIMAYVLALFIQLSEASQWFEGAVVSFWTWLGFVATVKFSSLLWGRRTLKSFLVHTGFMLVSLLIMGSILVVLN